MTASLLLDIGSTNLLTLTGLRDTVSGQYPTDATVRATLYVSSSMQPVTGAENIPLSYVATTSGAQTAYQGVLPADPVGNALQVQAYLLVVTVTDTGGNVRTFYVGCAAVKAAA